MAESVQHLVPSLIIQKSWDIAKSRIAEGSFEGKGNKKSQTWQSKSGGAVGNVYNL